MQAEYQGQRATAEYAPKINKNSGPRVGCGAAIIDPTGKFLLGKRRRQPETGCWGWLGGKVEWMETVEDAVRREIREEIGVEIELLDLLCVVNHFETAGPIEHWVAPVFLSRITDKHPTIAEPEAIEALGWFDCDDLPADLTQAVKSALPRLRNYLGKTVAGGEKLLPDNIVR
nr:NUDIX domain-containing protein [Brucella intermedia]